jgi:hypothetical protein
LHLDFKLGKNGEQLGLAGYDGKTYIDSLTYCEQHPNSSSGRYPDGNKAWIYSPSTPGKTNTLPVIKGLFINEFSADNENISTDEHGENDDWIEIFNSNVSPVDIGGLFLTDSLGRPAKHRISSTYPDSTTVPAQGYLVLWADDQEEQGVLHLGFKLGKDGEQIGLAGYDGMTYINSLTYGEQYTNSSSGRYPDGKTKWIFAPSTPGKKNTLPSVDGIFINEFSTDNENIAADEQGDYDDWIEIFNATDNPVNLGGLFITDSLDRPAKHRIPSTYPDSTTVPAHGYLVLWADNQDKQGILHLDFKLGKDGEQIGLAGYDEINYIDAVTYGEQYSNASMSRYPDGENSWAYVPATPGSKNTQYQTAGLYINEIMPNNDYILPDEFGEYDDWIEIYNSGDKPANIGGLFITDSLGNPAKHRISTAYPDSTTVPAHGYLVLWSDDQKEQGMLHLNFKLGKTEESVGLAFRRADGFNYIDSMSYKLDKSNILSYGRIPDGTGSWSLLDNPTPNRSNTITAIVKNECAGIYELHQNWPNPFDRETTIEYYLPEATKNAAIQIYDICGTQVRSIPVHLAGFGYITLDGSELRAGMYMYNLVADGLTTETKKMILMH